MTAPATPVATVLVCHNCGHVHSQAMWEYQSGYCHACGVALDIPVAPDPRAAMFASWKPGPHPTAGIIFEHEEAIAALIATQDPPPPPNANPPGFGNPSLKTTLATPEPTTPPPTTPPATP